MSDAAQQYIFTAQDRARFDSVLQVVRSDPQTNALFEAVQLTIKHDLSDLRMAVAGYETFLRGADAAQIRVLALLERLEPIVARIEVLEARASQHTREIAAARDHVRAVERRVAALEAKESDSGKP